MIDTITAYGMSMCAYFCCDQESSSWYFCKLVLGLKLGRLLVILVIEKKQNRRYNMVDFTCRNMTRDVIIMRSTCRASGSTNNQRVSTLFIMAMMLLPSGEAAGGKVLKADDRWKTHEALDP